MKYIITLPMILLTCTQLWAYDVTVALAKVRSEQGNIIAVLCTEKENFPNQCLRRQVVKAKKGVVMLTFNEVENGKFAVAAFHDENDNQKIDSNQYGYPAEGVAFSNNVMGPAGPPSFKQSQLDITKDTKTIVKMLYFK